MTLLMCHYARLVLEDELPGPYTDDDARRFARLTLLADHDDLSPQPDENDAATAARLGLPAAELGPARHDPTSTQSTPADTAPGPPSTEPSAARRRGKAGTPTT